MQLTRSNAAHWPSTLWIVRHGQSAGNVAHAAADAAGLARIGIEGRDVDVPLSPLGCEQASGLGRWFARDGASGRPDVMLSSPYVRALQTAKLFRDAGGCDLDEAICLDERLREREFGILDGLTHAGIAAEFPDQSRFRDVLGKFYHRPPGGESWADVILRLRSLMDTVSLHYSGMRVMIVAHQVVVLCLRYIIETLDETQVLEIDRAGDVANCGVTEYHFRPGHRRKGGLVLTRYNETAPVEDSAAPVTSAPDPIVAMRG